MNSNPSPLSKNTFEKFCDFLAQNIGLSFSKDCQADMETKISAIIHAFEGDKDPEACLINIMEFPANEKVISTLAKVLSVGETYFFRDSNFFNLLETQIFPEMIIRKKSSKKISIWSTGCATGEEPYSIAILLHRLIPDIADWEIEIIGSDINKEFLKRAEQGVYKKWSFRTISPEMQNLYFEPIKNQQWLLKPEIRSMVKFYYANMIDAVYPKPIHSASFDLIVCHNVLIYFTPEKISQAIQQLSNRLVEGGLLSVTAIEVPYIHSHYLIPCHFGNLILFRKGAFSLSPSSLLLPISFPSSLAPFDSAKESLESDVLLSFSLEQSAAQSTALTIETDDNRLDITAETQHETVQPESKKAPEEDISYQELEGLFKENRYLQVIEKSERLLAYCRKGDLLLKEHLSHTYLLICSYANQKKLDQALYWCQKYLDINALDPKVYCLQATIFQELKQGKEAAESLKKALYLDPTLIMAHFELGCLLQQQKNLNESKKYFRNAIRLLEQYPSDASLPNTEGILAGDLKKIIESRI